MSQDTDTNLISCIDLQFAMRTIRDSRRTHPQIRRDTRPAIAAHPKVVRQYSVK